jgi:APA family basic amino acid/polyamine antiporter
MLGIGIFLSPPTMAQQIASPWIFFGVWVLTAVVIFGGAVAYAELGTRYPAAGGDYVFHREAFGPSVAFATGWGLFGAIFSGSIAMVAVALFQYQVNALLPWWEFNAVLFVLPWIGAVSLAQVAGIGLVVVLTGLNARGVRPSALAQQIMTLLPLVVLFILALVALGIWSGGGIEPHAASSAPATPTLSGLVVAYLAAYFAFSGWNQVIYIAGEVEHPERTIPRSLMGGMATVTVLYLVLCLAFIAVLGMDGLASAGEAGGRVAEVLVGEAGRLPMNALVLLCLLATLNGSILGGGRVAYAMAQDGAFWRPAARLHAETGSPNVALWLQAAWSTFLILTNSFDSLLQAVGVAMVALGSLTMVALFVERRVRPSPTGYKAFGYPALPLLYLAASAVVMYVQLRDAFGSDEPGAFRPLFGLAVIVIAWAVHASFSRWARR